MGAQWKFGVVLPLLHGAYYEFSENSWGISGQHWFSGKIWDKGGFGHFGVSKGFAQVAGANSRIRSSDSPENRGFAKPRRPKP